MKGNIYEAIQILAKMMLVKGHVYPAAEEPLVLNARYMDGTTAKGESHIAQSGKIDRLCSVVLCRRTSSNQSKQESCLQIVDADMVV